MAVPEFYVGYLNQAPPGLARFVRRRVVLLFLFVIVVGTVLAASQHEFGNGVFEFGRRQSFTGEICGAPYPILRELRAGQPGQPDGFVTHYLVAPGKHGAQKLIAGLAGRHVRLDATRIYRDDQAMLEVVPGSIQPQDAPAAEGDPDCPDAQQLGTHTFRGEIVDSKCYLGVMNPGNLKPHRDCAVRCISGGIPPVLLVRDDHGAAAYLLLTDAHGGPVNQAVLDRVAEPLEITGELQRIKDRWILAADPETYRRLE